MASAPQTPLELFDTDSLVGEEELAIRDTVRRFVEDKVKPELAEWYESASIPARDLTRELGALGVAYLAVRQLAGQRRAHECRISPRQRACHACRQPRA